MNAFLGISLGDAIARLKACEDEKATAIDIGSFVCHHFTNNSENEIDNLKEDDIASAFDSMIAKLLSDIDIYKAEGKGEGSFTQDDLVKISKAGNYVRYAAYDLIKGLKSYHNGGAVDFEQIMADAIDRKIEEDTIDPATEEEVDKIISETEDIMDSVDSEDPENPFYDKDAEGNGDEENGGRDESSSCNNGDDGSSGNSKD